MNLMPREAMEATEVQWLRWIGRQSVLQIVPVLIKFDDDKREAEGVGPWKHTENAICPSQGLGTRG